MERPSVPGLPRGERKEVWGEPFSPGACRPALRPPPLLQRRALRAPRRERAQTHSACSALQLPGRGVSLMLPDCHPWELYQFAASRILDKGWLSSYPCHWSVIKTVLS